MSSPLLCFSLFVCFLTSVFFFFHSKMFRATAGSERTTTHHKQVINQAVKRRIRQTEVLLLM